MASVVKLVDLSDERRAVKTWLPSDDRDVSNGLVIIDSGLPGQPLKTRPRCKLHGSMNRVDPIRRIYRCSDCGVGAEAVGS
jgi:hypothetical protein